MVCMKAEISIHKGLIRQLSLDSGTKKIAVSSFEGVPQTQTEICKALSDDKKLEE